MGSSLGHGLALVCSALLLTHCLAHGLGWNALMGFGLDSFLRRKVLTIDILAIAEPILAIIEKFRVVLSKIGRNSINRR
jgi:hypothetical protein